MTLVVQLWETSRQWRSCPTEVDRHLHHFSMIALPSSRTLLVAHYCAGTMKKNRLPIKNTPTPDFLCFWVVRLTIGHVSPHFSLFCQYRNPRLKPKAEQSKWTWGAGFITALQFEDIGQIIWTQTIMTMFIDLSGLKVAVWHVHQEQANVLYEGPTMTKLMVLYQV